MLANKGESSISEGEVLGADGFFHHPGWALRLPKMSECHLTDRFYFWPGRGFCVSSDPPPDFMDQLSSGPPSIVMTF